jgi:Domain of unknown function (DUF4203)
MLVVSVVVGALLLTLGRKIFWFFVAATGFYAGLELASRYLNIKPDWVALLIALAVGLVGAALAYFFQKLVIGLAGFLAGVFITSRLVALLGTQAQVRSWDWLIILIGGIVGIFLMVAIFEWALIFLSSLAGAILIVEAVKLAALLGLVVGVLLFVFGVVFQIGLNRRNESRKKPAVKQSDIPSDPTSFQP